MVVVVVVVGSHVWEGHYVTGNTLNLKNVTPDITFSNLTNIQDYSGVIFSKSSMAIFLSDH